MRGAAGLGGADPVIQGTALDYTPSPPQNSAFTFANESAGLSDLASTGYRKTRPDKPLASVGQFIIELRDLPTRPLKGFFKGDKSRGLSSLFQGPFSQIPVKAIDRLSNFRRLGGEYLNLVFGWKPFVNDLRKMYNLWATIDKQMAQIIRNNGRGIRRGCDLGEDETTTETVSVANNAFASVWGAPTHVFVPGTTHTAVVSTTKTKQWYKARFRYWIPDVSSSEWDKRARAALFGASPTPELLWEVMPWSWLVNWFSNVGDAIANTSPGAVDNLTQDYAFVMKRITQTNIAHCTCSWPAWSSANGSYAGGEHVFTTTLKREVKIRVGGMNPFGFGVQLPSLSSGQLGILAALGASRSRVH